jgi:hypothetical protein
MRCIAAMLFMMIAIFPAGADELQYGQAASYSLNNAVSYPDFRVVYRGERASPDHGGQRVRDFEIYTDCTMFSVSWPVSSREPLAIDSGVGPFVLEFGYSKALQRPLRAQEFIAWNRAGYDQALAAKR